LERNFKAAVEGNSTRYFQVQIKEERLVQISSKSEGSSVSSDFDSMVDLVKEDEASYFLFQQKKKNGL